MRSSARGLTLLELIGAMGVAGILFSIGIPAYSALRERVAASSLSHRITTSLVTARTMAISRRTHVAVCPTRTGQDCADTTDWTGGWIVFRDRARTGQPSGPSDIISVATGTERLVMRSTAGRALVRYQPDGRSYGSNVTLSLCSKTGGRIVARVIVNNTGRVRVDRSGSSTCQ